MVMLCHTETCPSMNFITCLPKTKYCFIIYIYEDIYEDRVQQCKLTTLETRRVRGDQIEVFKITHGIEGLDSGMFFKYRTDNGTRGHSWALARPAKLGRVKTSRFTRTTKMRHPSTYDDAKCAMRDAHRCDKYTCIPVLSKKVGNSL